MDSIQFKLEALKRDVIHTIRQNSGGVYLDNIWCLLHNYTGRKDVKPADYGVKKKNQILELFPEITRVQERKRMRLVLVTDESQQRPNFQSEDDFPLPSSSAFMKKEPKKRLDVGTWKNIEPVVVLDDDESEGGACGGRPGRTAMDLMKAGNNYGDNSGRQSQPAAAPKQPASADFISLVDDDIIDVEKKPDLKSRDLIDLTMDSPVNSKPGTPTPGPSGAAGPPLSIGQPRLPLLSTPLHFPQGYAIGQRPLLPFQGLWQAGPTMGNALGAAVQPPMSAARPPPPPGTQQSQAFETMYRQQQATRFTEAIESMIGKAGLQGAVNVHVKPIHRVEFEPKDIVVHHVYLPQYPSKEMVNNIAKECIETLAEANEYVSIDRIQKLLCQRTNVYNIQRLGVQYPDQIPCIRELNMTVSKINAYILAFVKSRSICTLHELHESLREYVPNKADFTEPKLGPLQRLPEVYR